MPIGTSVAGGSAVTACQWHRPEHHRDGEHTCMRSRIPAGGASKPSSAGVRKRLRCKRLHHTVPTPRRRSRGRLDVETAPCGTLRGTLWRISRRACHASISTRKPPVEVERRGTRGDATGTMRATLTDDESLRLAVLLHREGIASLARRANCSANTLRAARSGRRLSGPTVTVLRHLLAPPPPARAA